MHFGQDALLARYEGLDAGDHLQAVVAGTEARRERERGEDRVVGFPKAVAVQQEAPPDGDLGVGHNLLAAMLVGGLGGGGHAGGRGGEKRGVRRVRGRASRRAAPTGLVSASRGNPTGLVLYGDPPDSRSQGPSASRATNSIEGPAGGGAGAGEHTLTFTAVRVFLVYTSLLFSSPAGRWRETLQPFKRVIKHNGKGVGSDGDLSVG